MNHSSTSQPPTSVIDWVRLIFIRFQNKTEKNTFASFVLIELFLQDSLRYLHIDITIENY
jgi:hypothetical protein